MTAPFESGQAPGGAVHHGRRLPKTQGFRIPLGSFVEGDDPIAGPVLLEMDEGRWRMPWGGGPAMLCVGREAADELSVMGCRLLEKQAPVGVTLTVQIGGLSIDVES